jgi:hypothetical protein
VTSLVVVTDAYMVDSSTYITMDTHALFNARSLIGHWSLVKIEKSRGPKEMACSTPRVACLTIEKLPLNKTLFSSIR